MKIKKLDESMRPSQETLVDCLQDYLNNVFGYDGVEDYVDTQYPMHSQEFKAEVVNYIKERKNESLSESKKLKEGITDTEPVVKFQGKSSHTFTKDKKWEVDFDEAGNIVARTRHGKPSYFKGHINDKVNDFPITDEDNIILAAREQHELKFGNKEVKEGYSHFEFTSGSNPYIAKTKDEAERIKRSRGDFVKYVGNINGIDYYKVDDSETESDLFRFDESKQLNETEYGKDELWNQINNNEWAYNSLANKVKTGIENGTPKERIVYIVRNAIASMKNDFGRIPTTQAERLELARDFVEDELQGYSFEDGDPDVLPWKRTGTWSKLGESFKPSNSGIQSVKCYNPYNYTIQELRVDNDNKTFERGNFTAGKADKKTKNRQEYEDIVDALKELGYTEIKSDYRSMRNKSRKGLPTNEDIDYSKFRNMPDLIPFEEVPDNRKWQYSIGGVDVPYTSYEDAKAHMKDDYKITDYRDELQKYIDKETGRPHTFFVDETFDGRLVIGINWGDWKHEHGYADYLVRKFFMDKGLGIEVEEEVTEENGSDTYSADHYYDINDISFSGRVISESNSAYYVTVYEEVSTSGPEEGGYTNYGWEAIHSKKFNSKDNARKYLNDFADGAEVIYNSGDTMEIKDEWGDTYKIRVESEDERGSSNAPAKTWAEAEMGVKFDKPFFDDEGKRLPEDPAKTRAREEEKKALENEYLDRINALKTMDDIMALLSDSHYGEFVKYEIADKYKDKLYDKIMEIRKDTTNESLDGGIEVETIADYIVDHYDFDDIDDKYSCIDSIKDSFKNEKTISKEELEQFIGSHNGKDKVNESKSIKEARRKASDPKQIEKAEKAMFNSLMNGAYNTEWMIQDAKMIYGLSYDEAVKAFRNAHNKYMIMSGELDESKESINEASYGGAFDIADDQYFTRDDLNDFAEEVLNHINETFKTPFDVSSCYIDNGVLELCVTNDEYGDYIYSEKIDMRKIKEPWHLKRAYAVEFASQLINDITQSNDGLVESFDDDVDDLSYYYDEEDIIDALNDVWEEIASKSVPDSDGFMTDYTMYRNINTGEYVFVFGDKDIYRPEDGYFDWECETEEEAKEWFDNYVGFDDDLVDECWSSKLEEEAETSPIVHKKSDGSYLIQSDSGDGYTAFNKDNVCQGHISASNEVEAKNKFNSNKFDE